MQVDHDNSSARRGTLDLLPSSVALGLLVIALLSQGAFDVRNWAPLGVTALLLLALAPMRRVEGAAAIAIVAIWSFAGWSALSGLWSDSPGAAYEGACRAFLYAGLFSLPIATLPRLGSARRFAVLGGAALGGMVFVVLALVVFRGDALFLAGRLDAPIGYRNGTAALFVMAFWPLICLAAGRRLPAGVRAMSFSAATTALALAFLTQSRGAALGFLAGGAVVLLLGPVRLRRAWLGLAAVAIVAVFSRKLIAPYDAFLDKTDIPTAVDAASGALIAVTATALLAMLIVSVLDNGLRGSDVTRTRVRQVFGAALGVGVVVALAGALAVVGNPVTELSNKVDEFRSLEVSASPGTRLGSTGGQRYDLWQVAGRQLERAPVVGEGEGSYRFAYYRERQTDRNLITPHSLPLRVLGELGIVGLLLLVAFLAAAATAIARGARRGRAAGTAAAAAVAGAFFAQTLVDWLWLIPGITGVAMLSLGLAVALASTTEVGGGRRSPLRPPARAAVAAAALAVAALYLSDYEVRSARAATGSQPQLEAARRAARLNPWAITPALLQAGALEELGRRDEARRVLEKAGQREPKNFVLLALRGDLELRAGRERQARGYYRRALQANPKDVGLQQLARGTTG